MRIWSKSDEMVVWPYEQAVFEWVINIIYCMQCKLCLGTHAPHKVIIDYRVVIKLYISVTSLYFLHFT